ncbi:MAG: hypothetical protein PHX39_14140, partial [Bacteroidales bacterium]|nr:hypothetical protein [Bacteroidales bacterium]MDD4742927.1 hypothetical protein [Bacteroidales bacterium]
MAQKTISGRMLRPIRRLWLCIALVVLMAPGGYGQLDTYLNNMEQGYNFYDIRSGMNRYLDSLRTTMDSAIFFAGDSEYKRFKLFESIWESRLSSHGDFSIYYDAMADYYNNKRSDYTYYSTDKWHEIGPNTIQTSGGKGIGPVEFLTFYDNGTADSTFIMLTGSTVGGLFYSTDTASTWQPTGTDEWPQSGCSWAIFHPKNHLIWYAASSGNSASTEAMFIGKLGGIQRTHDEGKTWHTIADYNDFGKWTKIYQITLHPVDHNIMYASTSAGLWKTYSCNISEPTWTKVLDGFVYDIEFRPDIDSVMYAAIYDKVAEQWKIMISESNGDIFTWEALPVQPEYLTDGGLRQQHFTIEVSKARPGYLFCFTRDISYHSLYYVNIDNTFSWQHIATFDDVFGYGDGHGFGVEQTGSGDTIFVTQGLYASKYNIFNGGKKGCSVIHSDVEDLVYHPYQPGEVWACTHGGVEKLMAHGTKFIQKYNGLGVGQVEGFATAYSESQPVLAGLYHDGNQITTTPYQPGWKTDWKQLLVCDGMKPVIDNTDADHMFISGQWGDWWYTTDAFQTYAHINNSTHFLGVGVLNKKNPDVFFMNNYDPIPFENVKRKCWDDSSLDGTISNFQSMFINPKQIITFDMYTPHTDSDILLANMIVTHNLSPTETYTTHRLMRTKNANEFNPEQVLWHELPTPTNKRYIGSVAFNPDDADKIILSYTTQAILSPTDSMIFKIDYTNLKPIVEDITYNLPTTSISKNCIAVDKRSNGGIYLATEYGIFYTDDLLMENPENAWQLIGTGLPHVRPAGIEINYISHTIRVATFGRGVWELNLPCITNSSPIVISTDTIWNTNIPLQCGIVVEPGATLTIAAGGEVYFPPSAKVVVKPGARLVLDSCLLTRR